MYIPASCLTPEFGFSIHDGRRVHKSELDKKSVYRLRLFHFSNSLKCTATPCTITSVMLYWTMRLEDVSMRAEKVLICLDSPRRILQELRKRRLQIRDENASLCKKSSAGTYIGFWAKMSSIHVFAVVNCDISQILTRQNILLSVQDKSVQLRTSQEQNVKNMDHSETTPEVVNNRARHMYKTGTGHVLDPSKDCYVLPNVRIQYKRSIN